MLIIGLESHSEIKSIHFENNINNKKWIIEFNDLTRKQMTHEELYNYVQA